jgi:hypothetical protein
MLLYSSEFNWSSQPWRILKWPSTLTSSLCSSGSCAGCRGPKSLFARARLGRWEFVALTFWRTATVEVGDGTRWAAAEEELGRDEVVSCDGRISLGASAAATVLAMSTGAWAASGLGRCWPEAVLMVSSSVDLGSSQQRPCRMDGWCARGRAQEETTVLILNSSSSFTCCLRSCSSRCGRASFEVDGQAL